MKQQQSYEQERADFIENIINKAKYSEVTFSDQEKRANSLFLDKVISSFAFSFSEDFYYDLAMKYKEEIQNHQFFKDITSMPKGVLLHHHMTSSIDVDWLMDITANNPHIYRREFPSNVTRYPLRLVYTTSPKEGDIPFKDLINEWQKKNSSLPLRQYFLENLTMLPHEIAKVKNNAETWNLFMPKYYFATPLLFYKEFYKQHIMKTFQSCVQDRIYRLESRLTPGELLNEDMSPVSLEEEMQIYYDCLKEIRKESPEFSFGIIVEMIRKFSEETILKTMEMAFQLKAKYPDLIIGIDLDGDEDNSPKFEKLSHIMLRTKEFKEKYNNVDLPWILHCGESLKITNQNPIDGYLLKAKRLGHGINLFKHSYLLEELKKKNVCIEICPISNQALRNVRDLRMHPALGYLNMGLKITINNDDPTLYNTKGLDYDLFVAMACCGFDLLDLKVILLNSIDYCEAEGDIKRRYKERFLNEWAKFIEDFMKTWMKSDNRKIREQNANDTP